MSKPTKRSQIIDFVESQGTASFTEIQRFIVDLNYGEGTYDSAKHGDRAWDQKTETRSRKCNPWRGYYCGAFANTYGRPAMLLSGKKSYLVKDANGRYSTVRVDGL